MATSQASEVIQYIRSVVRLGEGTKPTDGHLLESFISHRDEAAFAALVKRHGPMVWGVCRRVLRSHHDAEDAFQATFLVLVRKAASVASRELLANWLYGVAYRTALKARATNGRRRMRERQVVEMPEPVVTEEGLWRDLEPVLDQELSRLPDKYQAALVLCDLEGKTRKEAAQQLKIPQGTVSSRLTTARGMLAKRLARHDLLLAGGALAAALSQNVTSACVPTSVMLSTVEAATSFAARQAATTGVISAKVAALVEGVLKSMLLTKLKMITVSMLVTGILVGGVAGISYPVLAVQQRGTGHDRISKPVSNGDSQPQVTPTWKERIALKPQADKGDQIFAAAISPDGKTIATGQSKGGAKLLDATTGKELAHLYQKLTFCTAFSPDGTMLATGHLTAVKLWDVTTGQERASLEGHAKNCRSVAFAPDGKTLATASETIRLWNVSTGGELRRFNPKGQEDRAIYCVAFSPDGRKLASAEGPDKTVKLWDVATGNELKTFQGHTKYAIAVAFSPDGKRLASAGGEGEIKLWDIASGKEQLSRRSPTTGFASLAFSPDGKTLASAGGDEKTVLLWKLATGEESTTLTEHEHQVWTVAFSSDGKTLVTAGDDAVRLWDATAPPAKRK